MNEPTISVPESGTVVVTRTNLDGSRTALFSEDMAYRFELLIVWDDSLPLMADIGLNPSKADEFVNDPTVHRNCTRAANLGFGSLLKLNLFAFRSTDPQGMLKAPDPYGAWIYPDIIASSASILRPVGQQILKPSMVVATWGNHGIHRGRADAFRAEAKRLGLSLFKYEINGTGEPTHPLYLAYSVVPTAYEV